MKLMIMRALVVASMVTTAAHILGCGLPVNADGQTNEIANVEPAPHGDDVKLAANGKYAEVNGLKMYYEIHGTGRPLVLLHGAFGWATVYPTLAKNRQVIAIELQGHGHTADIDRSKLMS